MIVTAADQNYFRSLLQLLMSLKRHACASELCVYDLGMSAEQLAFLTKPNAKLPKFRLKHFEFAAYPEHVKMCHQSYAWKPLLINEVLSNYGKTILWLDSATLVRGSLDSIFEWTHQKGCYVPYSGAGSLQEWTHSRTLELMKVESWMLPQRNRAAGVCAWSPTHPYVLDLVADWKREALRNDCILPHGATRDNHRHDQSILNILLLRYQNEYGLQMSEDELDISSSNPNSVLSVRNKVDNCVPLELDALMLAWFQTKRSVDIGLNRLMVFFKKVQSTLFHYDIWNVGIVEKKITTLEELKQLGEPNWLPECERLQYIADPFYLKDQEQLLVEAYDHHRGGKGRIARLDLTKSESSIKPELAIDLKQHASYPYLFEDKGECYCIPECHASRECRVYRKNATGVFEYEVTLLKDKAVVDPTLLHYAGYWWLFFTDHDLGSHSQLFAAYALDWRGAWTFHPQAPLKTGLNGSRPAGPFFELEGKLYRPAQDCSRTYGGAMMIFEVIELTSMIYREKCVHRIEAEPASAYPDGRHHLVIADGKVILDGKKTHFDVFFKLRQFFFHAV